MARKMTEAELRAFRGRLATALKAQGGNVRRTARLLGLNLRALYYRMDRLAEEGMPIDPDEYRPPSYRRQSGARRIAAQKLQGAPE